MARAHFYRLLQEYSRALNFLNQAVALQSWIPALLEKTEILIILGKWDQAAETIQRVLHQNERTLDALRLSVLVRMTQNSDETATIEELHLMFKSMERYESTNAMLYFQTACSLSRVSGRRAPVIQLVMTLCKRAVDLDPTNAEYVVELAHQKAMLGDYHGAMLTYREAGRNDEANLAALYGTIYCQVMIAELEDAEQQLDFLLTISESIDQSAQLPYLKALLAWRRERNEIEHVRLLRKAEKLHFQKVANQVVVVSIFDSYRVLDPDFLIQLAKEFLIHAKAGSNCTDDAVNRGINILERVVDQVPGLIEAHLLAAGAQFATGQFDVAARTLDVALECDSQSAPAHLLMAQLEIARNNFRGADTALEQAIACDFEVRKAPAYALVKSKLCLHKGSPNEALGTLHDAMRASGVRDGAEMPAVSLSERVALFITLGEVFAGLGRFDEATSILAEARERFRGTPEEARVIMSSSMLAAKRNDFDNAVSILCDIPQASSAYIDAMKLKAKLYLTVKHDKCAYVQCFQDLVALDPSVATYEQLGGAYMHIQAPDSAIKAYEKAHNIERHRASLAAKIANALVSTHEYLKATNYYLTALQAHTNDTNLRHDLAKLYMKLQKYDSAIQVLAYALEPVESAIQVPKMKQGVQSLILLAEVYCCTDEHCAADLTGSNPVEQVLLRAQDLQHGVMEQINSTLGTESITKQKMIMGRIHCSLARVYVKEKSIGKAIASYQDALKIDNNVGFWIVTSNHDAD